MLPENRLSTINLPTPIIGARAKDIGPKNDYEDGPVAIGDPSLGVNYQEWYGQVTATGISIGTNSIPLVEIITAPAIATMSFTFDQNGRPTVAYTQYGNTKIWWYDSTVSNYITTQIGVGILSPKVFLDDKRNVMSSSSDIILGYVKDGNLCYRQQRDRYNTERVLATGIIGLLNKIGMGSNYRIQFVVNNY